MARRDPRTKLATKPDRRPSPTPAGPSTTSNSKVEPTPEQDELLASIAEFLRKAALGLSAMLFVIRAYFPSEDADTGSGLVWVFAVLATTAIGLSSALIGGTLKLRWSWADASVIALMTLVAMSASHAADRRPAITMAWEWGALGLLYLLVRNLPKSRGESAALAGSVVATAVAVSAYGLYQPVEISYLRELFQKRPDLVFRQLGIEPGTASADALRQRLLFSSEVFSTFALANSLAGFLVGPLALCFAVGLENLKRDAKQTSSRLLAILPALVPGLMMLVCLGLTKSRSAWIGLGVALLVLAWRARKALPKRVLIGSGIGLAILLGGLVAAGVATKQLDRQVITQASLSLRYRWEYWVGAWGVITNAPSPYASTTETPLAGAQEVPINIGSPEAFWKGVGPANFAIPYLRHKLPQASEEVQDPHNLILEVWASSGVFAMLALVLAIGIGLRETLGPGSQPIDEDLEPITGSVKPLSVKPPGSAWLVATAGLGWIGVWAFGKLNPMVQGDLLARWLILGLGWGLAILFGSSLWKARPIAASGPGLGVLAISINLLAAGGIGMPSVAMSLWVLLAIGLNLREDRPCGRLREFRSLWPTVGLACIWAALAGTYFGAVTPFWHSEAERAAGDEAMSRKPPAFEVARQAYLQAIEADRYNVRPFIALANLEYAYWRSPEGSSRKEPIWMKVNAALSAGLDKTWRNPNNLNLRRLQARFARMILDNLPENAKAIELLPLMSTIVRACRSITQIYPTSAIARADLAQASAEIGMYRDAVREANQALVLDGLTPHRDKKLPIAVRTLLESQLKEWEKKANEPPPTAPDPKKR
jgi:O-antigen ligase